MKYCNRCGGPVDDNAIFCSHCGYELNGDGDRFGYGRSASDDTPGFLWFFLGFICVPVGIVFFFMWRHTYPKRAKYCAIGALVSAVLSLLLSILLTILMGLGYVTISEDGYFVPVTPPANSPADNTPGDNTPGDNPPGTTDTAYAISAFPLSVGCTA